ncbi:hypothetical protein AR687_16385 [Flavobacteriaceae bacterium CRH]|nr:hypothetical protein AR687_16385 [Flavobacteriaceae bacterium CRH]
MDNEKIKILRSRISIPLNIALQLLKKNNGDIELCEQEFHGNNIQTICTKTECDYQTAKDNYEICDYDIIKAVEKINQKQVIITTGKITDSKIGFILWPENSAGEFYKTSKRNDAFIPTDDFDIILKDFESVFAMRDASGTVKQESFDVTGHNFFDNKTCREIVEKISQIKNEDENVQVFITDLITWLNDKLVYADYIVVYGNL